MQNKETKQEQLSFHTENFRKRSRYTFVFVCMIAAFFVITVLNINTGNVHISVPKILRILFLHDGEAVEYSIIWKIRLPRILMAALLGGALSLSGFLLQTFFSNPIAGPFVLGISSGAKMAVALTMIVFLKYVGHFSSYTLVVAAFIGSLISTGFILLMSKKIHHMASLLVGGIMIGYICSAITDFVVTFADDSDFSKYLFHYDYAAQQTGFVQPYADSPMDNEQVGEEVYISMINKAEKYCWFMTPYLIITDEMTHALCLAAKRGVDVRIITPGIPDKKFIYNITRSFYHGLVKHGVRVYEWTPGFCHAKMSVADDCMATCGTINLDYRSLYHHFENGCFMADCQAVVEIKNDLIRTMGECRDVTDQYQTGRSAYLRLGQLFMRLFAGLL